MTAHKVFFDTRSKISTLALLVIFLFFGAVVFTLVRQRGDVRQAEAIKSANSARESFEAAQDLVGLDDDTAKEKLVLGREALDRAVLFGLGKRRAKELDDFYSRVRLQIFKVVSVEPQVLYKFERGSISDLVFDFSEDKLVFLDTEEKKLFALDSSSEEVSSSQKEIVADTAEDYPYIIVTEFLIGGWNDAGFEVSGRGSGIDGSAAFGGDWEVTDVVGFSNWVYALSSKKNQIFKFYNTGNGYAESAWLGADIKVGESSHLGINGDVYVWSDTLYKFTKGRETDFYLRLDLEKPLKEVRDLVVWPGGTFLYLLDSDNGRVLQVNKEGLLENQYVARGLNDVKALAVNTSETKAFVLTEREILEFPLD